MPKEVVIVGGSFNPPGLHHRELVTAVSDWADEIVFVPIGSRPDSPMTNDVPSIHRAVLADLNFCGLAKVRVDLSDLENDSFTPTHVLAQKFGADAIVSHVVHADCVRGGRTRSSTICQHWQHGCELWDNERFLVVHPPGAPPDPADMPPHSRSLAIDHVATAAAIRNRIFNHEPIDGLLFHKVARYIDRHGLYRGVRPIRHSTFKMNGPRLMIFGDPQNPESRSICNHLAKYVDEDPEVIVVVGGDGTMLRAIREHWRRRLPFFGLNTGHLGFLLNDRSDLEFWKDELVLYQLPLLRVDLETLDGTRHMGLSFNDAWVERGTGQTAWIELRVNGEVRIPRVVADGMLVSTAAGSTSYARAMGATPIPLHTPVIVLVGSNVLMPLNFKTAVLPRDSEIEMRTIDPNKRPLQAYLDGVSYGRVRWIRIRVSRIAAAELAFSAEYDPAAKLAAIQFPMPPGE